MARVVEIKRGWGQGSDLTAQQQGPGTRSEWEEPYLVRLDGDPRGPEWVPILRAKPEWAIGGRHGTVPNGRVLDFSSRQRGRSWVYECLVRYETLPAENIKPLEQRPRIRMRSELVEEPVYLDEDGRPIVTKAGELILGLTDEVVHWLFNVSVNLPGVPKWLLDFPGAVNLDPFRIWGLTIPAGHGRITSCDIGELQEEDNQQFYPLALEIRYHPRGWKKEILHRGLYELQTRTVGKKRITEQVRCVDGDGEPVEEPVFLDREGRRPRVTVPVTDDDGEPTGESEEVPKSPLDPSDIVILEKYTRGRKRRSFAPLTFLR